MFFQLKASCLAKLLELLPGKSIELIEIAGDTCPSR